MHVCLKPPSELTGAEVSAWRRLGAASHDNPFLSPDFAQAVGRVRADARVLVVRDAAGEVRLLLPMQLAASGLARPLGAPMCDVNGPIGAVEDQALLPQALGAAGVAAYAFSGWTGAAVVGAVKMRAREGSAVADLRGGFDGWLEAQRELYPKHFKKMRRLARQGEKDFGSETVTFGPATAEDLATLISWKRERFSRTRRHDVLGPAWTRGLLETCAAQSEDGVSGVMAVLRFGRRIAAVEFGLRSGSTLHGWMAGYDPALASCSPGLVLQERLLERAAGSGVRQVVLGKGEDHYKRHYASFYAPVDDGVVTAAGLAGGPRAMAAGLLHVVEQGRFGPASRLAGRTRRRLDVILAVETSMGGQLCGVRRALNEDPAVDRTQVALTAALRVASF
jgi:CelD/BcsL family acetyltransferase involved in cellulose biosynthesis